MMYKKILGLLLLSFLILCVNQTFVVEAYIAPDPIIQPEPKPKEPTPTEIATQQIQQKLETLTTTKPLTTTDLSLLRSLNDDLIKLISSAEGSAALQGEIDNALNVVALYDTGYGLTKQSELVDFTNSLVQGVAKGTLKLSEANTILYYTSLTLDRVKPLENKLPITDKRLEITAKELVDVAYTTLITERVNYTELTEDARNITITQPQAQSAANRVGIYHKALNNEITDFFGVNNVEVLEKKLLFQLDTPNDGLKVNATIHSDVALVLASQNIEALVLKVNGISASMPRDLLDDAKTFTLNLGYDFTKPQNLITTSQAAYATGQILSIEAKIGSTVTSKLTSPIKLTFDLNQYTFDSPLSPNRLAIHRYNTSIKLWQAVGGKYNAIANSLTTTRDNLSQYTVLKTNKSFSDISNSTAKDNIDKLLNKGILSNTSSVNFTPKGNLTREEFVAWLAKAYGIEAIGTKAFPFTDVAKTSPYYNAIYAVYSQGLIGGKTATTFNPKGTITKVEMAKLMSTALEKYEDKQVNLELSKKLAASAKNLPSWSVNGMSLMVELGLYTNADIASPNTLVTREQAANILGKVY